MSERRHGGRELDFLGGKAVPYSKGLMARVLVTVGVPEDRAGATDERTPVRRRTSASEESAGTPV